MLASCQHAGPTNQASSAEHSSPTELENFTQQIPGTTLSIEMVAVPAGESMLLEDQDKELCKMIPAFWIQAKETTWDLYDTFVYQLDEPGHPTKADGMTRPSKPYVTFDRGWGHTGYPALSMSAKNAEAFCEWLSAKTGRTYKIPTRLQWNRACELGLIGAASAGSHGWYLANSSGTTHPVGTKRKSALGTYDMWGNVAEWVTTPKGPVLMGGSYRDLLDEVGCSAIKSPMPDWNDSDPQIPKSSWWLADAPFVGLRVVCVD